MGEEIKLSDPAQVSFITNLIVNVITCPFTVLINVVVIMAVKRRRRLQSNSNILLACLAATDAFTSLLVQPSFILSIILKLCGTNSVRIISFHNTTIRVAFVISSFHLILVTFERLMAIKFTLYYPYIITEKNIKVACSDRILGHCSFYSCLTTNNTVKRVSRRFSVFVCPFCCDFLRDVVSRNTSARK